MFPTTTNSTISPAFLPALRARDSYDHTLFVLFMRERYLGSRLLMPPPGALTRVRQWFTFAVFHRQRGPDAVVDLDPVFRSAA